MNRRICKHDWEITDQCGEWQVAWCRECGTRRFKHYIENKRLYRYPRHLNVAEPYDGTRKNGRKARRLTEKQQEMYTASNSM